MAAKRQVVFMVGNSRGAKHGDRRSVDPVTAEKLVRNGLARYPDSKAAEPESE
jgi:hypothetical protein